MTNEEILEGNKLIAEFMDHDLEYMKDTDTFGSYHEYWDWLMPVVEKMEEMGYCLTSDPWSHQLIEYGTGDECVVVESEFDYNRSKIEELYIIVIDFIKWYNQHGKQ